MNVHHRRIIFSFTLFIFLLALAVILLSQAPNLFPSNELPRENGAISIHFCPVEDCEGALLHAFNASKNIRCAFYDLDDAPLQKMLAEKNASILIFEENHDGFGMPVPAIHGGLMHNKFCILDGKMVITGSLNPTKGMFTNDNNLVMIEGAVLAENYLTEWEELAGSTERSVRYPLINHTEADNRTFLIENYFCPEDRCQEHVLAALQEAQHSVRFLTYSFTDDAIGDLLVQKAAAGVDISGVFEKSQESKWSEYTGLKATGIDVRLDSNPSLLHHKFFIIDDTIVITGSYNPSKNGDERNDENMLIIHDQWVAARYNTEFGRIFTSANISAR